ncbi:LptA/OstA family protein [Antarcticirhabdus aurantiaca]|uniref:OstA family protein n=1 Tax=Antarcticirhabdus aurantiaca TaxID=2606717 RepID=A0ACD4NQK4_9HYPH|nr:LptA/OstA family protein [Antarcticirhabdus aurantiaca]WAJ29028.1 OstA family protein [Jeongeuplla avenae]
MKTPFRSPAAAALALGLLAAVPAAAQGFGQNFGGLQVSGDQPIAIESEALDVDDAQAVATFTGKVTVSQNETQLVADRLVVHYVRGAEGGAKPSAASAAPGGSGQIERLEAAGNVRVRAADQLASADNANFDMKSQVVVMNGNVVLTQGENVAEGCRLTIKMDTGVARLESACGGGNQGGNGRVKMVLTPGQGAAARN